jgi:hypothetical protein
VSNNALIGVDGARLSLDEYLADYMERFEASGVADCWKLERRQTFVEEGSQSYDAFARGDWDEALRLIRERRDKLREYHEGVAARGVGIRRVRVVEQPISPYLMWELNSFRQRRELGELIRVVGPDHIADLERNAPLPEVVGLDGTVAYEVIYNAEGETEGALRTTDESQIEHWRGVFDRLYRAGEDLLDFFDREVAGKRPPNAR